MLFVLCIVRLFVLCIVMLFVLCIVMALYVDPGKVGHLPVC